MVSGTTFCRVGAMRGSYFVFGVVILLTGEKNVLNTGKRTRYEFL